MPVLVMSDQLPATHPHEMQSKLFVMNLFLNNMTGSVMYQQIEDPTRPYRGNPQSIRQVRDRQAAIAPGRRMLKK